MAWPGGLPSTAPQMQAQAEHFPVFTEIAIALIFY